jgi:CheY-like chemotaxis protein
MIQPGNSSLLVVDDSPTLRALISRYLSELEADTVVHQAANGDEAIHLAAQHKPEVIVMDWEMPVMDGIEAVRILSQDTDTRGIPVIMLTGTRRTTENLEIALEAGAMEFVHKPVDPAELRARVRSALRISRAHRHIEEQRLEMVQLNRDLKEAIEQIRTMSELLSMCAHCRKIREDDGSWSELESYVRQHTDSEFSHGICPSCAREHYPEVFEAEAG